MPKVITTANLIVGKDGSTTRTGSSIGLSTDEDRKRFKELRAKSDLILIGGNTARREPYKRTPIPLYILTHSKVRLQPKNQLAKQFALDPIQMIEEIATNFDSGQTSPIKILIEAGPKLLLQMTNQGLVDYLYLTVNTQLTGDNPISFTELTSGFELLKSEDVMPCQFRYYKKLAK